MPDTTFSDILEEAARKSDDSPGVDLLRDTWTTLVGRELARLTEPLDYDDGTLRVTVASEAWKRELMHRRGTIIKRVNAVFPWRVSSVEFRIGEVTRPAPSDPVGEAAQPVSDAPVDEATEAALDDVDAGLKRTLRKIRRHMLAEQDD